MAKQLGFKNIKASIALGEELIIPYTQSKVFADIDDKTGELFILVKHAKDPSIHMKLFFKEDGTGDDDVEIMEETKTNED
jgi:hypothetical protein